MQATFASDAAADGTAPDMDDPQFWAKLMPESANRPADDFLERGGRRRKTVRAFLLLSKIYLRL